MSKFPLDIERGLYRFSSRSALLTDLLVPAKSSFRRSVYRCDNNCKYVKWQAQFSENPEKMFELPVIKSVMERVDDENNFLYKYV